MNDFVKMLIACVTLISAGIAWAVVNFTPKEAHLVLQQQAAQHVPASEYEKHLENEESRYVLELKKEIREIRKALAADPGNQWLRDAHQDLIDTLCELRPNDRACT